MTMGERTSLGERPFGPEEFAAAAVDSWMKSPEHRPHIVDPRYDLTGIGVAKVGGQAVVTQVFRGSPPGFGNEMPKPKCRQETAGLGFQSGYHQLAVQSTGCR